VPHFTGDEVKIVTVPPFAESVSEGDVRWEKGKRVFYSDTIVIITYILPTYFSCCWWWWWWKQWLV